MTNTNALTGLPTLPEGQFWRVAGYVQEDGFYFSLFSNTTPSDQMSVQIVETYKKWEQPRKKNGKLKKDAEAVEVEKERLLHYKYIQVEEAYADKEYVRDDENGDAIYKMVSKTRKVNVRSGDLNAELIRTTAESAYERWQEILVSRSFIGDYPPLSLIDEEVEDVTA